MAITADWSPVLSLGEAEDKVNSTTNSTDTYTIQGHYRGEVEGVLSAGTGRITRKKSATGGLAVKLLDLDVPGGILDMVVTDLHFSPGDEVKLILDNGATGMVSIRLLHPREA